MQDKAEQLLRSFHFFHHQHWKSLIINEPYHVVNEKSIIHNEASNRYWRFLAKNGTHKDMMGWSQRRDKVIEEMDSTL